MDDIIADMAKLSSQLRQMDQQRQKLSPEMISLERYICQTVTQLLVRLFERPSNAQQPFIDIRVS